MANYQEVVRMLGDNLASLLELAKKLLIDWAVEPKKLLHTLHNIRKEDFLGLINGTHEIVKKISGQVIHPDYKLIKSGIQIVAQQRDRKAILGDSSKYYLGDNFRNNFYNRLISCKTDSEVLCESELLKYKKDKDIVAEMKITEITAEQIAERVIQLGKIENWTIVGYSNGLVVYVFPYVVGRVSVDAYELDDWYGGRRLLSRDMGAL